MSWDYRCILKDAQSHGGSNAIMSSAPSCLVLKLYSFEEVSLGFGGRGGVVYFIDIIPHFKGDPNELGIE